MGEAKRNPPHLFMPSSKPDSILIALSGGVDSSVAAALLIEQGWRVHGVTMAVAGEQTVQAARAAADQLGIPLTLWEDRARFEREIVAPFVVEYQAGRTPNPCVLCNRRIKFQALYERARGIGAYHFATGHYARTERRHGRTALRRARWRPKDQSYVLSGLNQHQLERALFPLGSLTKDETRERAAALGLPSADRPESQEICFIPNDDYRTFLEKRLGPPAPGPIFSCSGERLGRHTGLIHYTIGQRRGLGIAAPRPYYVVSLDPEQNALIVGHDEDTRSPSLHIAAVTWQTIPPQQSPFRCRAQIRYRHRPAPATARPGPAGLEIQFDAPQRAVTPGQWAALYDADGYVLAAGTIER